MRETITFIALFAILSACSRHQPVERDLTPADFKFGPGSSTAVISGAQKFIIPVANLGARGEPLVYPRDHAKSGQPILDYQGRPISGRGLVFFNSKDQSWQAVAGDGQGVIIINEVSQEQARLLDAKIRSLGSSPDNLSTDQLRQALAYARDELKLGDMYNSTRSFVREKMTSAGGDTPGAGDQAYGLKKRDDRDVYQAIYVPGRFSFKGPAATPQLFADGGVIIEQGGELRGVQPEVFMRTYRLADGRPINSLSDDIVVWPGRG